MDYNMFIKMSRLSGVKLGTKIVVLKKGAKVVKDGIPFTRTCVKAMKLERIFSPNERSTHYYALKSGDRTYQFKKSDVLCMEVEHE